MAQALQVRVAGLYTYPSDVGSAPPGALSIADNVVCDRDGVIEPRRGFDYLAHGTTQSVFPNSTDRARRLFFYDGNELALYNDPAATTDSTLAYHDATGWHTIGVYTEPTDQRMRSVQANSNFYFTTSLGVYKLDKITNTPSPAGCPPGLDNVITLGGSASTWLAVNYRTAYRVVWGIKDDNQNQILGAPSQFTAVTNTSAATTAVTLVSTIPSFVTTSHFYQVYRSQTAVNQITGGVLSPVDPSDEMALCYEGNPTSTDLTNGYITVVDITPDALLGAALYTNATQEGLANGNAVPPQCIDMANFRNCTFYANTKSQSSITATLLGVGSSGLRSGDTLTINEVTYTAGAAEDYATDTFQVFPVFTLTTTGTVASASANLTNVASVTGVTAGCVIVGGNIPAGTYVVSIDGSTVTMSQNATGNATGEAVTFTGDSAASGIRKTAESLCRVINRAESGIYAFYMSGVADLPGKILLQTSQPTGVTFTAECSRAAVFSPDLKTAQTALIDEFQNVVFYSKISQPEAVPLPNYLYIGSQNQPIYRILALRDALFILKADGVFMLYGTDPSNFTVVLLDNTSTLIAPDSAVTLNNEIYALTTQGVVTISDVGVKIKSRPIESDILDLISYNYATLRKATFAVEYESGRAYFLYLPTNPADTYPTQYFRYNSITDCWTHGNIGKYCGAVNPVNDKLYLSNLSFPIIDVERKSMNYSDYADYDSTQTITSISGSTLTISSPDTIPIGSIIWQSETVFGQVEEIDADGTVHVTLSSALAEGPAQILAPIECVIEWVPITLGDPGVSKQIRECSFLFMSDFNGAGTFGFSTDLDPNVVSETVQGSQVGGWGLFGWGGPADTPLGVPWGGAPRRRSIRVIVPRTQQRSNILTVSFSHSYSYAPWKLLGYSVFGNNIGERVNLGGQ